MGRRTGMKWEKSLRCAPVHNIISSDFPKYVPQTWKFMEGPSQVALLLSYEYQRMWINERDLWQKRMYPEATVENVDVIKRYVLSFKNQAPPPKVEKKKPFRMKKFEGIAAQTKNTRSPDDKAMNFNKPKTPAT